MKKVLGALCVAFGMAAAAASGAELVERIVARVNDRLITQSEFDKRVDGAVKAAQGTPDRTKLRREALDDLIKEKLLEERAKELSVTATDAEIEEALGRVKAQYNLSTDQEFEAALTQSGVSKDELRKQLRDTITIQKVIGRDVTSRLEITDDMLRLEYEREKERVHTVPAQARVAEIVVRFEKDSGPGRERASKTIAEAQAKIQAGTPFADVAKQYSEGKSKDRGGDLGMVSKGELLSALDAAVFSDPPSENPPPVILPAAIYLFHVTDRKAAGFKPFTEVKEDIKKRMNDELYDKRFGEYVSRLKKEAFVKIYDPELAKLEQAEKKS